MENKNKRKFSARGVVVFLAFWLLVGSFFFIFQTCTHAIEPPPILGGTDLFQTNYSLIDASYIYETASIQFDFGSFNNMRPLLLAINGTQPLLYFSYSYTSEYVEIVASQTVIQNKASGTRLYSKFTEGGFAVINSGFYDPEFATEKVIAYWNADGQFVRNDDFYTVGTSLTSSLIEGARESWLDFATQATTGGGGDGSQVIVNELDIGSIIASLPQAARNILDSTFGFELFGINIAATLTAVLLVTIVAFVIKWLMSR